MVEERARRAAVRSAREISHCATSLAAEAAALARLFEAYNAAEPSVAASRAALTAAQASFAIDDLASAGASLPQIIERAEASLEASILAVQAAKQALATARHSATRGGSESGVEG